MPESTSDDPSLRPCLRVFLSVDLAGSTRLKNVLNHQLLWSRFRGYQSVIDALRKAGLTIDGATSEQAILTSLKTGSTDLDWSNVVEMFYEDFHSQFRARMSEFSGEMLSGTVGQQTEIEPWKAIGDELIYVFEVSSRRQLHWIVIAFIAALRTIDGAIFWRNRQHNLRLKGAAWVAGFPVRNRQVKLPGSKLAYDYLGPEIDTGFRIGKCTRPGMLAVSIELAELLAEIPSSLRPAVGMIVGWEQLKGVWEDRHYPIIWVDLPDGLHKDLVIAHDDWELQESHLSRTWASQVAPKPNLTALVPRLVKIREALPSSLGIVDPYIVGDPDSENEIPLMHGYVRDLLAKVAEFQCEASRQDADTADHAYPSEDLEPTDDQINVTISDVLTPNVGDTDLDDAVDPPTGADDC